MTNERKNSANRRNAKRSTGPKSREGKRRASGNALRHGLAAMMHGSVHTEQVRTLALKVCDESDSFRFEQALIWAEAEVTLQRVRTVRVAMLNEHIGNAGAGLRRAVSRAVRLERYERRAIARRRRAIDILGLLRNTNLRPTRSHSVKVVR